MKFSESDIIKIEDAKENTIYVFGDNKKFHLGYLKNGSFFALTSHNEKKLSIESINLLVETEFTPSESEDALIKYSREWYMNFKAKIVERKAAYTGIILDDKSHKMLTGFFGRISPKQWNIVCHHMTINLGEPKDDIAALLGQKADLVVTGYSIDSILGVMALSIQSDVESDNEIKHITFAVAPDSSAMMSNKLSNFLRIKHIPISGVYSVMQNNKKIRG